jgi:hypothetical protein
MKSWMTAQAQTAQSASSAAAAQQTAKLQSIGRLTARSSKIPRKAGELTPLLDGYLDGTTGQYQRQKGVPESMQHLLSRMQWTVEHVLGREEDEQLGRAEIKPKLVSTFKLNSSEVANYAKNRGFLKMIILGWLLIILASLSVYAHRAPFSPLRRRLPFASAPFLRHLRDAAARHVGAVHCHSEGAAFAGHHGGRLFMPPPARHDAQLHTGGSGPAIGRRSC